MKRYHEPAMVAQVVEAIQPRSGGKYIDATLGDGGHAKAILEASVPDGRVLGIERDPAMAQRAGERLRRFGDRIRIVRGSYADIAAIAARERFVPADGILFDLGAALWHFTESHRGFSFRTDDPLDMRFDPTATEITAADIVNTSSQEELEAILTTYGEEREGKRIAGAIIAHRPIMTTATLAEIVRKAKRSTARGIHPATKTFQALRIAVNGELEAIEVALPHAVQILRSGGILAVLAYHSLEDRIVKRFFSTSEAEGMIERLTRKPLTPDQRERSANPRVRSAKLRVAIRR